MYLVARVCNNLYFIERHPEFYRHCVESQAQGKCQCRRRHVFAVRLKPECLNVFGELCLEVPCPVFATRAFCALSGAPASVLIAACIWHDYADVIHPPNDPHVVSHLPVSNQRR